MFNDIIKQKAVNYLLRNNCKQVDIARQYGVSSEAVRKWINLYLTAEQKATYRKNRRDFALAKQRKRARIKSLAHYYRNKEKLLKKWKNKYHNDKEFKEKSLADWRRRYHTVYKKDPNYVMRNRAQAREYSRKKTQKTCG